MSMSIHGTVLDIGRRAEPDFHKCRRFLKDLQLSWLLGKTNKVTNDYKLSELSTVWRVGPEVFILPSQAIRSSSCSCFFP